VTDLLSNTVAELGLREACFQALKLEAPWKLHYASGIGGIHLLERGRATIEVERGRTLLEQGDMVIVPRGVAHVLASGPGVRRDEPAELLCGRFTYVAQEHPLLSHLPPTIVVPFSRAQALPRWGEYVRALAQEVKTQRPGSAVIITRLSEILLVEAVRQLVEAEEECPHTGWLRGIRDEAVDRVLHAFHAAPDQAWSVESLAEVAMQSRSAFSERFRELMGEAPMSYVRRWRLYRVRTLLRSTDLSLDEIAKRTGYGSAAALSVAFVREQGLSPGQYRKQPARPEG